MTETTRFIDGINNVDETNVLADFKSLDPTQNHVFFTDFDTYNSNDWTVVATGTPTQAVTDEDGGVLLVTTSAGAFDDSQQYNNAENFKLTLGKELVFKCRLKISDVSQSILILGLVAGQTLSFNEGLVFFNSDAQINFSSKNSFLSNSVIGSMSDDTYTELSFYYDGEDEITIYQDGLIKSRIKPGSALPLDVDLAPIISFGNQAVGSKNLSVDYIITTKDR